MLLEWQRVWGMPGVTERLVASPSVECGHIGCCDGSPSQHASKHCGRDRAPDHWELRTDLNVRHFHEKLSDQRQIEPSSSRVKQALQGAGLQRERR
jgi:hypothetical protein